jgi:hypothetical protein
MLQRRALGSLHRVRQNKKSGHVRFHHLDTLAVIIGSDVDSLLRLGSSPGPLVGNSGVLV